MGVEILQWSDPDLEVDAVADPSRRDLLRGKNVVAEGLETFKQLVIAWAREDRPPRTANRANGPPPAAPDQLVFINAVSPDEQLAREVRDRLEHKSFRCVIPDWESPPHAFREHQQRCWGECTDLLLVSSETDKTWVKFILKTECSRAKVLRRGRGPIRRTALWDAAQPGPLGRIVPLPGVAVFNSRRDFDEGEFRRLVSFLKSEAQR
jgi:hypothetical protein